MPHKHTQRHIDATLARASVYHIEIVIQPIALYFLVEFKIFYTPMSKTDKRRLDNEGTQCDAQNRFSNFPTRKHFYLYEAKPVEFTTCGEK